MVEKGVVGEAPSLPQLKGARLRDLVGAQLRERGIKAPVTILNDADGVAAGLAARHGKLDHMIRVWTIGVGIGHGRYPFAPGVWEGGHTVVTLDDKETYCGCGGGRALERGGGGKRTRVGRIPMGEEGGVAGAVARAAG